MALSTFHYLKVSFTGTYLIMDLLDFDIKGTIILQGSCCFSVSVVFRSESGSKSSHDSSGIRLQKMKIL